MVNRPPSIPKIPTLIGCDFFFRLRSICTALGDSAAIVAIIAYKTAQSPEIPIG